jgi:hypothetical protein
MEITVTFIGNATTLIQTSRIRASTPVSGAVFASLLSDFTDEMKARGLADRIIELERGGSVTV